MAIDDAHDLMPAEIAVNIPPLYATENVSDPIVWLKLFTPDSSYSFYVTEYDPAEALCFGLTIGHEHELGYFSLTELQELKGPLGLKVERDLFWEPKPLSQCK